MLDLSAHYPCARRPSVPFADLARTTVLRTPATVPDYRITRRPAAHARRPVRRTGLSLNTIQEMLALVGADMGAHPVPTQATTYYGRTDIARPAGLDAAC